MKKLSLSKNGLSLSQAQSISNLCFQRAKEIDMRLSKVNNATKKALISGETYIIEEGVSLPNNVVELILEKARMHATQAFLMENIKGKDFLINELKHRQFVNIEESPLRPSYKEYEVLPNVGEDWGWNQLSVKETNEYLMAEAYAAHIGQFIHKNGLLEKLRSGINSIGNIEWLDVKVGEKTPVKVIPHHDSQSLLELHEKFAALHRNYEQRVNYYKAKVKNLVTEENARIANENAVKEKETNEFNQALNREYEEAYRMWSSRNRQFHLEFESTRQEQIKETASLRIEVSKEFKEVIDMFLNQLEKE